MNISFRKPVEMVLVMAIFTGTAITGFAQEKTKTQTQSKKKTETSSSNSSKQQEIVIRKSGGKDQKMTIVINGDNITVNGKPLSQFKDGDVVISKRDWNDFDEWGGPGQYKIIAPRPPRVMVSPKTITIPRYNYNFSWNDEGDSDGETRPMLGVYSEEDEKGAKITDVMKESAAEKAGLKKGDIITKVGDKKVEDPSSLADAVNDHKPNEEVEITYLRDGKELKTKVKLGERKSSNHKSFNFSAPNENEFKFYGPGDGMSMFNVRPRLGARIQDTDDNTGVKVLDVNEGSIAEKSGMKKDDIITEIDGNAVKSADDAHEALEKLGDKSAYQIKVKRNGSPVTIDVKIPKKLKTTNL